MKTQTFSKTQALRTFGFFALFTLLALAFNPVQAQSNERAVKGVVSDEYGPLENATVHLQGTDFYATTNEKGEFTFPKLLKENDVLVFHYLGYVNQKFTIGPETTFINLNLTEYEIIIVGALKVGNNNAPEGQDN